MAELTMTVKLSSYALKLREARLRKGKSVEEAEREMGMKHGVLLLYETDRRQPSWPDRRRLRIYYGLER